LYSFFLKRYLLNKSDVSNYRQEKKTRLSEEGSRVRCVADKLDWLFLLTYQFFVYIATNDDESQFR